MSTTVQSKTAYGRKNPLPMHVHGWRPVGTVDPRSLGEARRQAHNLVQWLARVSHSYIGRSEPEAKRLALCWQQDYPAMTTREFVGRLGLELRFPTLMIQFTEEGRPVLHRMEPEWRSPAEVEAWILVELLHRGVDRSFFSKRLPYQVPDLMGGDAQFYSPQSCTAELTELCAWFQNAAAVLELLGTEAKEKLGFAGEIHCWPHNLHMTSAMQSDDRNEAPLRMGFSPGESDDPEPYFYATRDPEPYFHAARAGRHRLGNEPLPSVLRASQVLASTSPADAVRSFFSSMLSARSTH